MGASKTPEHRAAISAGLKRRGRGLSPDKRCPRCKETKPRSTHFGVRKNGYTKSLCRECEAQKVREWRDSNPDIAAASAKRATFRRFNMTEEDWHEALEAQGGGCAICGRARADRNRRLLVDHCHTTGLVRGLLCSRCNVGLGMFAEEPERMIKAIEYLEAWKTPPENARYMQYERKDQ